MNTTVRTLGLLLALLPAALGTSPPVPPAGVPAPPSGPSIASGAAVAVIPVRGMIHDYTFESLRRRTDAAITDGATVIVYELDTNGGLVDSALDICKYIKSVPRPTIAWINNKALSAGTLIAAACDQIVMSPVSALGDCASITLGKNLAPVERSKVLSPILAEFGDSARRHGYDIAPFQAMCVLGTEVYLVEHTQTGVRRLVNQADLAVMVGGSSASGAAPGVAQRLSNLAQGQTLTEDLSEVGIDVATDADRGRWKLVRQVHNGKTLLTMYQDQAYEIGLSRNDPAAVPLRHDADLQSYLQASSLTRLKQHWIIDIAFVLTNPWLRAALVLVVIFGFYIEAQSPGLGIGGFAGLLALVVLIGAPYLVGLAEVWHLVLFVIGVALLLVELFVTPGFGVPGAIGLACMFVGLVLMVVPTTGRGWAPLPAPGMGDVLRMSVYTGLLALLAAAVGMYFMAKYFGSIPFISRLILTRPIPSDGSDSEHPLPVPPDHVSGDEAIGGGAVRVGSVGQAVSPLRPSGRALLEGRTVDVVAAGGWIEPGTPVRVVEVSGNHIVVDQAQPT